jgi:transposase InsO family protein
MPWQEICTVELRENLVLAVLAKRASVAELCRRIGVSRRTAYKWIERYKTGGRGGLIDQSRARHTQPGRISDAVCDEILTVRAAHPTWGARKLHKRLTEVLPASKVPAMSTVGALLATAALTAPSGKRRSPPLKRDAMWNTPREPNDLLTVDFKGQFKLLTGQECYPLTVCDAASRYIMAIVARASTELAGVMPTMELLFREHGLPLCIRSDNGSPFAGNGLGRLGQFNVWLLRLGIAIDLITPGRPGENGSHEQMHRVMKAEATRPPRASMREQQNAFDEFRRYYDDERYHEGIDMKRPVELYRPSPRRYVPIKAGQHPEADVYAKHWQTQVVRANGSIVMSGQSVFISQPLAGCIVGLTEVDDRLWQLHFCRTLLGVIDTSKKRLRVEDLLATKEPSPTKLYP